MDQKNQRRCGLVDKEIVGTLSNHEQKELQELQADMLAYRRKVAPLPLEDLRKLHQELLREALSRLGVAKVLELHAAYAEVMDAVQPYLDAMEPRVIISMDAGTTDERV